MNGKTPYILIITDGMFAGGMERQILELLKGLKQNKRFRTGLAVLERGGVLETQAATFAEVLLPIKRRARFDVSPVFALIYYARLMDFSLIHTFGWMSGLAGLVVAKLLHLPIINSGVRSAPPHLTWRHKISRWSMRQADMIVSNSKAGLQAYGLDKNRQARVIYNGLDLKRFEAIVPRAISWPQICMVANFSHYKDHSTVLQAMEIIVKTLPNTQLTLVGQDRGKLNESRQLVEQLGLTEAVKFVTNTIHPEPYIADSDVCVLASTQNESLSNAILEYMALGKPVVATACMGNAELIQEGKTGFLVPKGSVKILSEKIIYILQTPTKAEAIGQAGCQRVVNEFVLSKMVGNYEQLYFELLAKRKPTVA